MYLYLLLFILLLIYIHTIYATIYTYTHYTYTHTYIHTLTHTCTLTHLLRLTALMSPTEDIYSVLTSPATTGMSYKPGRPEKIRTQPLCEVLLQVTHCENMGLILFPSYFMCMWFLYVHYCCCGRHSSYIYIYITTIPTTTTPLLKLLITHYHYHTTATDSVEVPQSRRCSGGEAPQRTRWTACMSHSGYSYCCS